MNLPRTTYQTDFTPFDWLQNNVGSNMNEFCSLENVDECLKYISQEFSALGFPSIYSQSGDFPTTVNCDIVNFLNATYELLRSNNEYAQTKEDLETRNQRLCSDLNSLNKKNSTLKISLEQNERKLASALERERQLKEKNEQLSQQLKTEREENKKLTAQLRQQKVAYQHEIRKYENNMNQIKGRINQLLSDKNPNKKIATMTSSHTLPRNSGQRGKWKTGIAATTAVEEMYNSVISAYETRTKELCAELNSFRQYLQSIVLEIVKIISSLQDEIDNNTDYTVAEEFTLNEVKKECWDISSFKVKFEYLFHILKETTSGKIHNIKKNLEDQISDLKLKLPEEEKALNNSKDSHQTTSICDMSTSSSKKEEVKSSTEESLKLEKMKIETEKLALAKRFEEIEKEKAEIAAQKIALLRLTIQQKTPSSSWHESIKTFPSVSVITSQNGSRYISNLNQSKPSFSTPEQIGQCDRSFSPQWILDESINKATNYRKSDIIMPKKSLSATHSSTASPLPDQVFSPADLPLWAANKTESSSIISDDLHNTTFEITHDVSSNEELLNESSSEEIHMQRLKAAMEDIEKRRSNTP